MNQSPKVSVIIPAYNAAAFVGETLGSVFAQTFTDYEVIVINDGSPDTEAFERAIAPYRERINYIKQENRGASAARNAGLNAARGELVAFLDADDTWLTNYLQEQIDFMHEHQPDLICGDAIVFSDSRTDDQSYMDVLMNGADHFGEVTFEGLISGSQSLITSAVVARRQKVIEAGSFDENLRNAQDFDLWIRMALRGARMGYQRKVLARYRYREGSLSGDAVNRVNRELNLVLGKEHLNRSEFDQALECFRKARRAQPSWKLRVTCALLSVAPNVLTTLNSSLNAWRKRAGGILRNTP